MNKQAKKAATLTALFTAVYFVSYLTRINYGAVISEIVKQNSWEKTLASLALTGSAITYGIGQLLSGYMGDKIQPKNLIFGGLLTTMAANILIPFCSSPYQMTVIWCINGLAQAFMWPPLVKLMANLLSVEEYKKATFYVSCGSSAGTIFVYAIAPVCIHFSGWKSVFLISAMCALVVAVVFKFFCPKIKIKQTNQIADSASETKPTESFKFNVVILGIMLSIALLGALRDGTTTWLPSYVSENFNISTEISILTGILLPIFTIISYKLTLFTNKKFVKNEVLLGALLFITGFSAIFILNVFNISSPVFAILLLTLLNAAMHGASLVFTALIPVYYKKYSKVSLVSGMFNSCAYVGSAFSTYGTAAVSEKFGWGAATFLWCLLSVLGAATCLLITKKWKNQTIENNSI